MNNKNLSILIVEDNPSKKQKLFEHLQSKPDLFEEPEVCICISDAIKRMQEKKYDLLILDVVVPEKIGGIPREENSLELLERIDVEKGGIKAPRYVLPISSMPTLSENTRNFFRGRPWGIVPYDDQSTQSLSDIENVAKWILAHEDKNPDERQCDVFLITALEDPEFSAIEKVFANFGPLEPLDSKQLVRFCEVNVGSRTMKVAAGFSPRMGPVASALLTSKAIERLKPRLVVMAGICAGLSNKVALGDVVAAEASWDWQSGKFIEKAGTETFQIAPHQLGIDQSLRSLLLLLKRDEDFWSSFADEARALKLPLPKLVLGPMASGASVLANSRVTTQIKEEQHKNVIAVDMETYAVYAAADAASMPVKAISLKAVCDEGDEKKNDNYQPYAAKVSAELVLRFLKSFCENILNIEKRQTH